LEAKRKVDEDFYGCEHLTASPQCGHVTLVTRLGSGGLQRDTTNHVFLRNFRVHCRDWIGSRGRCLISRKDHGEEENSEKKANVTLPGTVEKIIPAIGDHIPEKAEIKIEGADDLYREVRIENKVIDAEGNPAKLKKGVEVDVTIEVDEKDTNSKEK